MIEKEKLFMKKFLTAFLGVILLFLISNIQLNHVQAKYDNNAFNWNYKPNSENLPVTTEREYLRLLEEHDGIFIGKNEKELYLTFDNGYENGFTAKVLDVLKEKKVPAAFFVTGHYLTSEPELVIRMVDEGHIVGNHSWHHPSLAEVSDERLKEELDKVKQEYKQMTGKSDMIYLRPPRGVFSERTLALSREQGYINVFWSMAYKDWEVDNQKGWEHAYEQIMKRVHPGAIMLLHSVSQDNAEALGKVIDDLKEQGYTFRSLDDLLLENIVISF